MDVNGYEEMGPIDRLVVAWPCRHIDSVAGDVAELTVLEGVDSRRSVSRGRPTSRGRRVISAQKATLLAS
jgi:hypothetical protein